MLHSVVDGMKKKTGHSLEDWLRFLNSNGPKGEKERRDWLKREHGLGTNYAAWIAARSLGQGAGADPEQYTRQAEDYADNMFAGPKEPLRLIYLR
jgi:Domain of unknown function (DUF4287)